jgi:16S rRNA (cytosine967-C5)-methyltransferase
LSDEKPREIAAQVLGQRGSGEYAEDLLNRALTRVELAPADRRLCQELVYGVVRWQATLDWLIARKTQNRVQKAALQNLLRLGLYQIFWLERIPNHAAVNETVEQAKRLGFGPQAGFVNAFLRGYLREFDATRAELSGLGSSQPSLGFSHPEWLVARWLERWGVEPTSQLLTWNNTPPKTFARINTLKADPARLLVQWRDENVEYDFVRRDWFEENLVFELKVHPPLESLPSFQQGSFYIQDPSTLLAVNELAPQAGETILDVCAAPGGKLSYMAQLMRNEGRLVAHDTSVERLKMVKSNCARLGITCADVTSNLHSADPRLRLFDRVLVDAPCSNTGVMRRRVDLRWRIRREEIERLSGEQLQLLERSATRLKAGGTLVYSTCSLEPEENQLVTQKFLAGHAAFRLEQERELRPFADAVDGAYVARLGKVPDSP